MNPNSLPGVVPAPTPEQPATTAQAHADVPVPAWQARHGDAAVLAGLLAQSRADTLATFAAYEAALPGLQVPLWAELNPPLWELGHIGWFQEFWLGRLPTWPEGVAVDPEGPRRAGVRAQADALYHSSQVPHDSRWTLPLPSADATRADLAAQLAETQRLLAQVAAAPLTDHPGDDPRLYLFRLALLHEDMHHEAALYMARALDLPLTDPRWHPQPLPEPGAPLHLPAGPWRLGSEAGPGFAFDNELDAHTVAVDAGAIDTQPLRWAEYLPFAEAGGYADARWWTAAGWQWQQARPAAEASAPRYLRRDGGAWFQRQAGPHQADRWQLLDTRLPAVHLTQHEALAWCRWAGRRLPTEAEWERAACTGGDRFRWGQVWEWTASPHAPYAGFQPHPYRDYSAPWMDGRPVLRGASHCTQPRMRHPRYRNYFPAHRNDVPAGLRSCAA